MTDKNPDNFIVKFFENECAIDIEILKYLIILII